MEKGHQSKGIGGTIQRSGVQPRGQEFNPEVRSSTTKYNILRLRVRREDGRSNLRQDRTAAHSGFLNGCRCFTTDHSKRDIRRPLQQFCNII